MSPITRTAVIVATASATLDLPEAAAMVTAVAEMAGTAGELTALTVQATAPSSGTEVQFTGTPSSPSSTLTLDAAATAGTGYLVTYIPVGAVGAA